uniref:ATP synthase CF1 subunit delta n=1 Tax=Nemalion vermiculare TaxID=935621 RepID=UPI00257E1C24|nr:ATP synthase CF1 subunit delta [Nemalion vermiculare]WGV34386.1 ATP synthase CF1 subunit delta [Nemalion vermiculare]
MTTKTLATQVSQPYAEALLSLAKNSNIAARVHEDAELVIQILSESDYLNKFLSNPLVNSYAKKEVIKKLFLEQLTNEVVNFILLLVDRKRITYLSNILEKYLDLSYSLNSFVMANVYSSVQLTDEQQNNLKDKLKSMTGKANVKLDISVDRYLIAGFTVQIGSKVIDTSLRGQLKEIGYFLGVEAA